MPVYGITGKSGYEDCPARLAPAGAVEMVGLPASATDIAQADGMWTADPAAVRAERDALLSACDFTQLPDAPLSTEQRARWVAYRQALRDIPLQAGFPNAVVWPTPPEE